MGCKLNREQEKVVRKIKGLLRLASAPWCIRCQIRMKGVGRYFYCGVCEPLEDNPWCVKCRRVTKASGVDRYLIQRWMCTRCFTSFLGSRLSKRIIAGEQVIRKVEQLERAIPLFRDGVSIRRVMRIVGISNATANKFRQIALADYDARCACGEAAGHRGWCSDRYQNSQRRQEFMRRWHRREI